MNCLRDSCQDGFPKKFLSLDIVMQFPTVLTHVSR